MTHFGRVKKNFKSNDYQFFNSNFMTKKCLNIASHPVFGDTLKRSGK